MERVIERPAGLYSRAVSDLRTIGSDVPCRGREPCNSAGEAVSGAAEEWQLFTEGDRLYESMLADIAAAHEAVYVESYIFAADVVGERFAAGLIERAQCGVRTRLRVDYAGSRLEFGRPLAARLRAAGVHLEWSHRWQWRRPWAFHRRNHRKLLLIDGRIGYVGGFNIHAASSRQIEGAHRWRDTHVRFTGAAVAAAVALFEHNGAGAQTPEGKAMTALRLVPNSTPGCRRRLRCELDRAFRAARRRIWLTTPYFVPDRRLRRRLAQAARRGVDVRLLVPGQNDVPVAQWAARALYGRLLEGGIRVYEYRPRVLHAKTVIVDGAWASVGSANLDYRSLFVNAEVNLITRDTGFCAALAEHFLLDLTESSEIRARAWRYRSWTFLLREALAWPLRRWL